MCKYHLQDGEIKQLRVPADEKRKFLDYQTQKAFNIYTDDHKGVIRCPNKQCKWVAEAQNPNDRFSVECPLCHFQFCSLCNQQYHYRTTCKQIPELTQRWFHWCNTGKICLISI
jgi:aspartate carbamoyltransferase regulatory subunit